jgi:adenosylcobinamide-phosphate synthase
LLAGLALDGLLGDPRRGHPVALFGRVAQRVERWLWLDSRAAGGVYAAGLIGSATGLGVALSRVSSRRPVLTTALATWVVLGGRSLAIEAEAVRGLVTSGHLDDARQRLTHLVGRRTEELDVTEISRAAVESVAENTSDAVVAPLFWGAVAGVPGLLAYRAVNTLEAMVGYRSPRYERFGWAAARADDIANYVPARLTAALAAAAAPCVSGRARHALAVVHRDGRRHPSPNAGMCEAAFAGALDVQLGGRNDYGTRVENRPVLGARGRPAAPPDIARAIRLSRVVAVAAALASAGTAWTAGSVMAGDRR